MIAPQYISSSRNTLRDVMEPRDAPDLSKYRVVDMFHRHTDADVKSNIISAFQF